MRKNVEKKFEFNILKIFSSLSENQRGLLFVVAIICIILQIALIATSYFIKNANATGKAEVYGDTISTIVKASGADDERVADVIKIATEKDANYKLALWNDSGIFEPVYFHAVDNNVSDRVISIFTVEEFEWYLCIEPIEGWPRLRDVGVEIIGIIIFGIIIFCVVLLRMYRTSRIMYELEHDPLTGLYNRQAFYRHFEQMLKNNPGKQYNVIVADVENFKVINSSYGEAAADELLRYLAKAYSAGTPGALYARYGGDQFVCVEEKEQHKSSASFQSEMKAIHSRAPIKDIAVNYGFYGNVDRELDVNVICDRALIAAKSIKHNFDIMVANYDGPVSKSIIKKQEMESNFEEALRKGEFKVWYQPKFDAATEKIVGAEALVRWIHDDGTIVSPGEFIPLFEEDGLIYHLDEMVFREVCEGIKIWRDRGIATIPISINLSRSSLYHQDTINLYTSIVETAGIPTDQVPLELTESAGFHSRQIKYLADDLKEAGFKLHMDDFGSGYSSLASLNVLPFDVVKLDKSLIDFIGDAGGDEIIRHIIDLAHFKNMSVCAEGVETKDQLMFLKQLGCDTIQGYYFAKPMPYDEFVTFLKGIYNSANNSFGG